MYMFAVCALYMYVWAELFLSYHYNWLIGKD